MKQTDIKIHRRLSREAELASGIRCKGGPMGGSKRQKRRKARAQRRKETREWRV